LNAKKEIIKSSFVVSTPPFFVDVEDPSTVDDLSDQEIEWACESPFEDDFQSALVYLIGT